VFFYTVYKPEFLLILAVQLSIDYTAGWQLARAQRQGKQGRGWMLASVISNLGLLVGFKYVAWLAGLAGYSVAGSAIVPLGLSFHTFQGIAYTVDVYRKQVQAERNFLKFCTYIFFFPQLIAGPIERPGHFMPQIVSKRFNAQDMVEGLRLVLWGLVQKMVVADRLALVVDPVFANPSRHSGPEVLLALLAFSVQLLADFSGYTDIARGCARMLGYTLTLNFKNPYGAKTLSDFWRRWHISLSSWFRDYVFIPLGGSKVGYSRWVFNILVVFALSGLWHGAQTTFLLWGLWHGIALILERQLKLPSWMQHGFTVLVLVGGWLLFRAESLQDIGTLVAAFGYGWREWAGAFQAFPAAGNIPLTLALAAIFLGTHAWVLSSPTVLLGKGWVRWSLYYAGVGAILLLAPIQNPAFIYFQF
jgi:D-alanyl-lipoteichoic acid acyltransferase DltB (MBOAT superfamily)